MIRTFAAKNVTPNKAKDTSDVTEHVTVNPVKRQRKKKPPSVVVCSRGRFACFLEKKAAGKPDLASPKGNQSITLVPRLREQESESAPSAKPKEQENTNPACGSKKNSVSLENQKQVQVSESDLDEQAILQEFLSTLLESEVDRYDDVNIVPVNDVCANCRYPPLKK